MNLEITLRKATREDVPKIVQLLSDDFLGSQREQYQGSLPDSYYRAFETINSDKNNYLLVAEHNNEVIGTLQLVLLTHLNYQGSKRGLIESVRVEKSYQNKGIGKMMLNWAIEKARQEGCILVQLTSNKQRTDAIEFYKKLGFKASHEGFKLIF